MTIDRILSIIAIIVSFIAVPASGYLSYRYAIKGEKRKEFNAIADIIRQKLREQLRLIDKGIYPAGTKCEITKNEMDKFVDVHPNRIQKRISDLWEEYDHSLQTSIRVKNEWNDIEFVSPELLRDTIKKIYPHCHRL
ncbi:hypothetical protein I5504_11770 [Citrobacter koseri]|uniref:hypothetical protein n=1 Tax=Citrobacter koseri TaxID=545 RepID=UPI0018FF596A|nr:hypothetical protein [Citrobacter koseri]MBJ9303732.1 hypothetical protein [Citrobacter koseri]MBJ9368238.1 hypothetical protein [Citrobacter koseri]